MVFIADPRDFPLWDDFVMSHPYGSVFHSAAWAEMLCKTFDYEPRYIVLNEGEKIKAALPFMAIKSRFTGNRLISLPRTSYCDPLVTSTEDLIILLSFAQRLLSDEKLSFIEIKTQNNNALLNETSLKAYDYFHNQILPIKVSLDDLWKGFDRSCIRQKITRAEKQGVKMRTANSIEDIKTFYLLHKMTTKKHMVPPRPFDFFKNIWDILGKERNVMILIAEVDSKPAAAGFFLKSRNSFIFEFLGLNYQYINYSPGHMIVWEAIKAAKKEGKEIFDFGLTPPDNKGLFDFKKRWGTEDNILNYYYYPDVTGYKKYITESSNSEYHRIQGFNYILKAFKKEVAKRFYKHFG